jgi:hypothetical protein
MGRKDIDGKSRTIMGVILSFVKAGGSERKKEDIVGLQTYIRQKYRITIKRDLLKKEVAYARGVIKHKKLLDNLETRLLTSDKRGKRFRYGAGYCKDCRMFKNYEKECPYCGVHEMTF